jgi:hypothetical protein
MRAASFYGLGILCALWPGDMCASIAWGYVCVYDLGYACGLGMHRLIRPGLHVWPRHIGLIRAWAARVASGHSLDLP